MFVLPKTPTARSVRNLAFFAYDQSKWELSVQHFTALVDGFPESVTRDDFLYRGSCFVVLGDVESAIADLNEAIKRDASCSTAYVMRGHMHSRIDKLVEAVDDYSEAIRVAPTGESTGWVWRGLMFRRMRKFRSAFRDFEKAQEIVTKKFCVVGVEDGEARFPVQGEDRFEEYVDEVKLIADGKALLFAEVGMRERALRELAIIPKEFDPEACSTRGLLHVLWEEYEEAVADLTVALQGGEEIRDKMQISKALWRRSFAHCQLGDFSQARTDFQRSFENNPRFPSLSENVKFVPRLLDFELFLPFVATQEATEAVQKILSVHEGPLLRWKFIDEALSTEANLIGALARISLRQVEVFAGKGLLVRI